MLKNYYKKSLFWFALSLLCAPATAQTDKRMVTDGREWIIEATNQNGLERHYLNGDTLIDGTAYKKLHVAGKYQDSFACSVRENEGKVYGVLPGSTSEYLLYDFSATPGDTLRLSVERSSTGQASSNTFVVWKTDAVTIGSRSFVRQWLYRPGYRPSDNTPQEIEKRIKPCVQGIGWNTTPFSFCQYYYNTGTLLGCRQNGEEIFMATDFTRSVNEKREYAHMVEKGKEWICRQQGENDSENADYRYFFDTDTLMFGIPHAGLYMQRLGSGQQPEFICGLIEVNRRVYMASGSNNTYQDVLLYDFSTQVGNTGNDKSGEYRASALTPASLGNEMSARIEWENTAATGSSLPRGYWIEGVGSTALPTAPLGFYPGYTRNCVLSCTFEGREIYNRGKDGFTEDFATILPSLPYHPMLREGKKWNYKKKEWTLNGTREAFFSYILRGDTLIGGRQCLKMFLINESGDTYAGAWYEEDRRVYQVKPGTTNLMLQYDFNIQRQYDVHPCCQEYVGTSLPVYLCGTDVIKTQSAYLNRYLHGVYEADNSTFCIEGVGGPLGLPTGWFVPIANEAVHFLSCYEDGKCLCTAEEMSGEAVDPSVAGMGEAGSLKQNAESRKQTVFDLGGRRVSTTDNLRPGIYIRNGKKVAMK